MTALETDTKISMAGMDRQGGPSLRVGVIGGSISGCTVAVELSRLGHEVVLLERSGEELKDRGAGIGIPSKVLDTYFERDLVSPDIPYFTADEFWRIWRTDAAAHYGHIAWRQPALMVALNWGVLYRNLRERVPERAYYTRRQVTAIRQEHADRVLVDCADGERWEFDLVVCADGYASLGRAILFPEVQLRYAGYVLWRGFLDEADMAEAEPLAGGVRCAGYPGGHGIFYFVPGADGSVESGHRLVNWGKYVQVPESELAAFLTDRAGQQHEGSLPPGSMPAPTERALKDRAATQLPAFYADLIERSPDTFAYAVYDCEVPAYCRGRVCLAGDAGAYARPHTGAGALKGVDDAISLSAALKGSTDVDSALNAWDEERTRVDNQLVRFGNQLGQALVKEIPDWSTMDLEAMQQWYASVVTIESDYIRVSR